MPDDLKIKWGDGVSALDRTIRALTLLIDGAMADLIALGYRRDEDMITIVTEGDEHFPTWVSMRGERLFEVNFVVEEPSVEDGRPVAGPIVISGRWLRKPKKRGWFARLFGR